MGFLESLALYLIAWALLVLVAYLLRRDLVKGLVVIMWSSERAAQFITKISKRLSFVPLRIYVAVALLLFLLAAYSPYFPIPAGLGVAYMPGFAYLLVGSTYQAAAALAGGASVQEAALIGGQAGAVPLLPGITIPWDQLPYIALAVAVGVALHEFLHGYAAVRFGIKLKTAGVFSAFFVASGAFVEPDDKELKESSLVAKLAVFASGVAANVALALAALAIYLIGVNLGLGGAVLTNINAPTHQLGLEQGDIVKAVNGCGISTKIAVPAQLLSVLNKLVGNPYGAPLCDPNQTITLIIQRGSNELVQDVPAAALMRGAEILGLVYNGPLYRAGVRPGDVLTAIYGCGGVYRIYSSGQLLQTLQNIVERDLCKPGDEIIVTVVRNNTAINYTVILGVNPSNTSRPFFGIYTNGLGEIGFNTQLLNISLFSNTLFVKIIMWFFLINLGLAMINALPIYPLDGGLLVQSLLERALGERGARLAIYVISLAFAAFLIFDSALGFMGGIYKEVFNLLK
ncbi:M50 family metallopeptidase [Thermoproteus tenax]|uniref:Membrane-associated Zn-dependent protease of family M50 fused to PDZ domain n=1 Tax=Thermoproteus tenax (strain ATCC 35583 / DSM 2078 / JCM 9277 / NBRC 100435 / Kra 1) TaxID=768679 RepID=G4RKP3_THETK|nr:M50 family metallopeptidase [Thermoproteus tenax]CCC82138.1 Membrane-associated Zn-dependent protease of family M50 fused to PDZ domain [Thermoproteus tenax Kra 1]